MAIVDVSKWQGVINWSAAKSGGVQLAILRVQDSSKYDERIEDNIRGCQENGIPFGVYGYFRARTEAEGLKEASLLLNRTRASGGGALFYVLDCEEETITREAIRVAVNFFIGQGLKVGLYIGHHTYPIYGGDYGQHFTWIPRYSSRPPAYPCDLWQYTSKGSIPGINGNVDLNVLCGGKTLAWFTDRAQNSTPAPTPAPTPIQTIPEYPKWAGYYLKKGSRGKNVQQMQQRLKDRGWKITVDGIFGAQTDTVVRAFQREKGLAVDGIVGARTWSALWLAPIT